ncbi:flagellin [Alkalimarinus sediminis]|uniref:Flagellin n=2 Tax=Alkalimarinus sediminis TaxID=1632866 RepID=A0A9E8KL17_9ALTE|nr:flagellin [Alkalimarinus sediminis]
MALDTNANIANAGLQVGNFSGINSGAISETQPSNPLATGDLVINGVPVGPSLSSFDTASSVGNNYSAISKAAAINEVADRTGVTAEVNAAILNADAAIAGVGSAVTGSFQLNGVQVNLSWAAADSNADVQGSIVAAVNNKSGQSGIRAEAFGNSYRLIADDGRNLVASTFTGLAAADIGLTTTQAANGSVTLLSAGKIELSTLTGAISTNSGFEVGSFGSAEDGQLIQDIDISTVDGAIAALNAVDNALDQINFTRADLGAIQNRFESTIDSQSITSENLTAANSRIRDADFAAETAELSRAQVLQSAGLSVLSQANAQPQQVLQLLQG